MSPRIRLKPDIRHVPAASVPYGPDIAVKGGKVWACYHDGQLVCVGATAAEARRKWRKLYWQESATIYGPQQGRKLNG